MEFSLAIVIPLLVITVLDALILHRVIAYKSDSPSRTAFIRLNIAILVQQAFSVIVYACKLDLLNISNIYLLSFVNSLAIIFMTVSSYCWLRYLLVEIGRGESINPGLKALMLVPVAIITITALSSPWTGWIFIYTADSNFQPGSLYFIQIVTAYIYAVASIIGIRITHGQRSNSSKIAWRFFIFLAPSLIGAVIQMTVLQGGYTQMGISFGLLCLYLNIYIEDVLEGARLKGVDSINAELQVALAENQALMDEREDFTRQLKTEIDGSIREFLSLFNNPKKHRVPINEVIRVIGEHFDADRTYIFQLDEEGETLNNTYEWCARGVTPEIDNLQGLPVESAQQWFAAFDQYGFLRITVDDAYANENPFIHEILAAQDITSLMAVPLESSSGIKGFLGVDNPKRFLEHDLFLSVAASTLNYELTVRKQREAKDRYLRDIQARKVRLEEYNDIVSRAGLGIWHIILSEGAPPRMQANTKMLQILGLEGQKLTEEEIYEFWYSRIAPSALDSVNASVSEMLEGNFSENTYLWKHPTKGNVYARCGGTGVSIAGGTFILRGYHSDVTDIVLEDQRKKEELSEARKNAEEANEAKTSFLFNMSHDIRTPMNAIIGFTHLLERDQDDPQRRADYLRKIENSSDTMLSIINNVLEMARIEKGTVEIHEEVHTAAEIFGPIHESYDLLLANKGIEFTIETHLEHEAVYCDAVRLIEVIDNLLSNASKYTDAGGKVAINVEEHPYDRDGWGLFTTVVSDTGIGISEEYLPHVFDEFSRERSATETKVEGTGLGMSIVKRLVDLMGGAIDIQSKRGEGTTITVSIPHRIALDACDSQGGSQEDYSIESFKGKRILLAEDNELNAEIAIEVLEEVGFKVERAENGAVCVEMLCDATDGYYDLILMDVQMPVMGGYEATRKIRSLEDSEKAGIPIIAMTANAFEEDKQNAFAAGMDGHLAKPINIPQLFKMLASHI